MYCLNITIYFITFYQTLANNVKILLFVYLNNWLNKTRVNKYR